MSATVRVLADKAVVIADGPAADWLLMIVVLSLECGSTVVSNRLGSAGLYSNP